MSLRRLRPSMRRFGAPVEDGERGEVTTTTLLFPALLLVVLLAVQFALAYHAKSIVTAAAQDGARLAQSEGGSEAEGRDEATAFVAEHGSRLLEDIEVTVTDDGDIVRAEVRGTVVGVVPGLRLEVTGRANGPVERFRAEGER